MNNKQNAKSVASLVRAAGLTSSLFCIPVFSANANPQYDHVVIVVEENHGYEQVIGSSSASFINSVLLKGGVLIKNAYGEQHPSQPNYFWLFSGSNQGIVNDKPYWTGSGEPVFSTPNLYTALEEKFASSSQNFFGGYVDSGTDSPVSNYYGNTGNYANRHVPWLGFKNINNGNPAGITQDFATAFPAGTNAKNPDYDKLPIVSFVIPALNHDMHDYDGKGNQVLNTSESQRAVRKGDIWLKQNLSGYAKWAKTHNSLLIVTWDEDSSADWPTPVKQEGGGKKGGVNPYGLTAPNLSFKESESTSGPNHIVMLFYGANLVKPGRYELPGAGVNNVNLLRTIESFYGLTQSGAQTPLATQAGLTDNAITEIFVDPN